MSDNSKSKSKSLPTDITSLHEMVLSQAEQIEKLENTLRMLQRQLFGPKSEKRPVDSRQGWLFEQDAPAAEEPKERTTTVFEHKRKANRGRKPLPTNLPRIEKVIDLSDEEKQCACGSALNSIGEEISERLDVVPAKIQVVRTIRIKYACPGCQGTEDEAPTVRIAPPAAHILPKGNATENTIAHIIVSKFCDALPLYRQEKIFKRHNIHLARTTMVDWLLKVSEQLQPIINLIHEEVRSGLCIQVDETTLQVFGESGKTNKSKSYMWVYRGGPPERPAVLYHYDPSREHTVPLEFLQDYGGYVQTDGYCGYDWIDNETHLIHLGCMAHIRRGFYTAAEAIKNVNPTSANSAQEALDYIGKLYEVEAKARKNGLSAAEVYEARQQLAKPILDDFKAWLDEKGNATNPKGLLGKAVSYALGQWPRAIRYIENGHLHIDNNWVENAIRPFVIGRKNWMFAASPRGAEASGNFYTLIENAKLCNLNPYAYLCHLLEQLPKAKTAEQYLALVPQHLDPQLLSAGNSMA